MLRVFLLRHNISRGMEDYDERKKFSDREMPLSETGLRHGGIMCEEFKRYLDREPNGPVTIITSDFKRTTQDAQRLEATLSHRKAKLIFDPRLREIDKGKFWGLKKVERENAFGDAAKDFYRQRKQDGRFFDTQFLGGESPRDVYEKRIEPFVKEYKQKFRDGDLVIVSHDIPLRFLATKLLRMDPRLAEFEKPSGCGGIRLLEGESWNTLVDRGYVYEGVPPPARPGHPEDLQPHAARGGRGGGRGGR